MQTGLVMMAVKSLINSLKMKVGMQCSGLSRYVAFWEFKLLKRIQVP